MLNKSLAAVAFILGMTVLSSAHAESFFDPAQNRQGLYFGANYSPVSLKINEVGEAKTDVDLTAFTLSLGLQFSDYVGVEARYGFGMSNDSATGTSSGGFPFNHKFELDDYMGGYLIVGYPVSDYFTPYGILGATRTKIKRTDQTLNAKDVLKYSGYSWGFGFNVSNHNNLYLTLEYLHLQKENNVKSEGTFPNKFDLDAETLTLGIRYKF